MSHLSNYLIQKISMKKNVDNIINDLNEKLKNKSLVKASDLVKPQKRTHNFHKPEKANENI